MIEGEFEKGQLTVSPTSKATYPNGNVYVGVLVDDYVRCGEGTLTYAATTGDMLSGEWGYDGISGTCKMVFAATGDVYEGEWSELVNENHQGHPVGMGTKVYGMSGDMYDGQWYEGRKHGQGRLVVKSTGEVQMGQFVEDVFIGGARASDGTLENEEASDGNIKNCCDSDGGNDG